MYRGFRGLVLAATLVVMIASAGAAADPRLRIGQVDHLQGSASASFDGAERPLRPADPIYLDDRLTTGADTRLHVRLTDETEINLGENADLLVDRFVYDPAEEPGSLALESLKGAFLFTGGLIEGINGATVQIKTPVATLGIRGTTAWGGDIDGQYGVFVLDGTVTVSTDGGRVTLDAGLGSSIPNRTSPPGAPKPWPTEKLSRAVASVCPMTGGDPTNDQQCPPRRSSAQPAKPTGKVDPENVHSPTKHHLDP